MVTSAMQFDFNIGLLYHNIISYAVSLLNLKRGVDAVGVPCERAVIATISKEMPPVQLEHSNEAGADCERTAQNGGAASGFDHAAVTQEQTRARSHRSDVALPPS